MARVRAKYVEDHASMAKFLMSGAVNRVAMAAGRDIANDAAENMYHHSDTGATAEGYKVKPIVGTPHKPSDIPAPRRAAEVYNEDPGAAANEFGYGKTPKRRPLRNAAEPYHVPQIKRGGSGWS